MSQKVQTPVVPKSHLSHIVCVDSKHFENRENGYCDFTLKPEHIIIAQRNMLEHNHEYRQMHSVAVFTCKGKVWAYLRTKSGNEPTLHDNVALAVGGHWDLADVVYNEDSLIDLDASLSKAFHREISEEVILKSKEVSRTQIPKVITADITPTDRKHATIVTVIELDGEDLKAGESELKTIGFKTPEELLNGDYNLETWATMICETLIKQAKQ